jgi:hypothetical protein
MHRAVVLPSRALPVVLAGALAVLVGPAAPALAATTVDLGTAGAFAVLAGSGITNTGQSTITGDIGTSPTPAETGVDPCPAANCVTLTGSNHPDDAVAQQAKQDLTTAYDSAAGQSADAALAADLGGLTFTSGVYRAAGSLGLTGEVTLDAQNVGGAVFVFQVGSAATLGTTTAFRGTIMAHDDISVGDAVTVDGRLLAGEQASGAGAVTLIHDTITTPSCTSGGGTGGGTSGTSGGTTSGTTGSSSGGSTGGSTGTGGTTGATTGGTAGATGGSTTGTADGTGATAAGGSTTQASLPFSGAPTGRTALLGLGSVLGGALLVRVGRRSYRPTH